MSRAALFIALLLGAAALAAAGCASPMTSAALSGDNEKLRELIASGAGIEDKDSNGETPLMKTAIMGRLEAARILLDAGADPNHGTMFGTPLSYALHFRRLDLAQLLLDRGATPTPEARALAEDRGAQAALAGNTAARKAELMRKGLVAKPLDLHVAPSRPAPAAAAAAPEAKEAVSDVDTPAEKAADRPDDFALLVGIEEYQSLPKAEFGARDARTVRRHLEALGFPARNIISLEGSGATKSKLEGYLQEWLPLNVKPSSTLFVYYSGHGAPDPKSGDAYLVPWDGDPKFLKSTAYPLKRLYAELAATKAKRVVVALDACFSGAGGRSVLAAGARPLVAKVDDGVPAATRLTVLAAASGDEITGTLDEQGHGLFTYHLLKALSADPKASARSLFGALSPKVQDDARRQNREQTPTLAGASLDAPLLP
jgi:hypothetical protein